MKNLVYIFFILIILQGIALPDDEDAGLPDGPTSVPPGRQTTQTEEASTQAEQVTGGSEPLEGTSSGGGYTRGEPEYSVELQKSNEQGVNTFFPGDEITVELEVQNMLKNRLKINYIEDEISSTFELVNAVPGGYNHSISNNIQKIKWDYSQEPYITTKSDIKFYYTIKSYQCSDYSFPKATLSADIEKRNGGNVKKSFHSDTITLKIDDEIPGQSLTLIPPSPIVIIDKIGKRSIVITSILRDLNKKNATYFIRLDNNIRKYPINNSNNNGCNEYMWDLSDLKRGEHTISLWMTYDGVDHLVDDNIIVNIYRIPPTRLNQLIQGVIAIVVSAGAGAFLTWRYKKIKKNETVESVGEADTSSADNMDVEQPVTDQ